MKQYKQKMTEPQKKHIGKRLGRGWTAEVYEWEDNQALKLFMDWWPQARAEYEFKTTKFASEAGLPVPAVFQAVTLQGRNGIVMERISGKNMLKMMISNSLKTKHYAHILAELQTRINKIEGPAEFQTVRQRLENAVNNDTFIPRDIKSSSLRVLNKLPDGKALCHFDLHPMNIIMSPKGPIVIDWSGSNKGAPEADIARTWMLCTLPPIAIVSNWPMNLWVKYFYKEFLKKYASLTDIDEEMVENWKIPILAGRIIEERTEARKKFLLGVLEKRIRGKS